MRSSLHRRLRSLPIPATLLLILLLALVPLDGALVAATIVLLVLLTGVVAVHYEVERRSSTDGLRTTAVLRSPLAVAAAVAVIVVVGSVVAISLALLLAVLGASGGDGRGLLRVLLAAFALAPCLSIGSRCGRWWSFSGCLLLAPAAALCVLIAGPHFSQGAVEVVFLVSLASLVVAAASLQHRLHSGAFLSRNARGNSATARPPRHEAAAGSLNGFEASTAARRTPADRAEVG